MPATRVTALNPHPSAIAVDVGICMPPTSGNFDRRSFLIITAIATCLALAYLLAVAPGTPSDEPSHFQMVQYYAVHWRLPILGEPGVSHEGQMGPIYYTLAGLLYKVVAPFSESVAFYAIRVAGLALIPAYICFCYRITLRLLPSRADIAKLITLSLATNATVLAMASSVQNDILTMVFAAWSADLLLRLLDLPTVSTTSSMRLGAVVSLAVLTKASAIFLVPGCITCLALYAKNRKIASIATFTLTFILLAGWWFLRNYLLYGDISAQRGLRDHGYTNAPLPPTISFRSLWNFAWLANAYYWVPTEYFRAIVHAPTWLRIVAVAWTCCMLVGWIGSFFRTRHQGHCHPHTKNVVLIIASYCVAIYLFSCLTTTYFAPRVMFTANYAFAAFNILGWASGLPLLGIRFRYATHLMVVGVASLTNMVAIWIATTIHTLPFHMFAS